MVPGFSTKQLVMVPYSTYPAIAPALHPLPLQLQLTEGAINPTFRTTPFVSTSLNNPALAELKFEDVTSTCSPLMV
jgi:hypothetical protein